MLEQTIIEDKSNPQDPVKYIKTKFLGKGGFGSVYEVISNKSSLPLACKIIQKSSLTIRKTRQRLMNEIRIHKSISHNNIVKFFKSFEDENNFYILLEICPNESLSVLLKRRKRLMELEVQCYGIQLLLAIQHLRSCGIIHRDIKLGNVLLSGKMEVKLADFGLSTKVEYEGERKRTICGTPNYIAPEILSSVTGHSYEVDVWSFGILIYTMLVGKPPFDSSDLKSTYAKIKLGFFNYPENTEISPQAKDLISKILVTSPYLRPTIDEIFDHNFFNKNKIPRVLPFSTLTVPLSESYQRAFSRKPLTAREFLLTENVITQRSISQANHERSVNKLELNENKEVSGSVQTTVTGNNSVSCFNLQKLKISSMYSPVGGGPCLWVSIWVDYSHKYGFAYKLSNNCIGVLFNDKTKVISNGSLTKLYYFSKENLEIDELEEIDIGNPPIDLVKKVQLVLYFSKFLGFEKGINEEVSKVHVKKWIITQNAMFFRMTNKTVQVYFRDQTEIILCGINKFVSYVDKNSASTALPVALVMNSENRELIKRLKFTKETLIAQLKRTER